MLMMLSSGTSVMSSSLRFQKDALVEADAWVVVNGRAYDVTKWIDVRPIRVRCEDVSLLTNVARPLGAQKGESARVHPGGAQAIIATIGDDASESARVLVLAPSSVAAELCFSKGRVAQRERERAGKSDYSLRRQSPANLSRTSRLSDSASAVWQFACRNGT
eukprot:4648619-Amphidinium_carterae.3